jgi:hypothetical protein
MADQGDAATAAAQPQLLGELRRLVGTQATEGEEAALSATPPTDEELCRFVAGSGSAQLEKAAHLYLKMRRWRTANNVDGAAAEEGAAATRAQVMRYMSYSTDTHDKKGRPLVVWRTGRIQARQLMEDVGNEGVLRNHVHEKELIMARAREASAAGAGEEAGAPSEMVVIMDMEGLGLQTADWEAMQCLRQGIEIEQRYYPETMAHIWITRPPWIFSAIYAMAYPWLDDYAKARITVLDGDDYTSKLLEHIDAEQLPVFLGGLHQTQEEQIEAAAAAAELAHDIAAGELWKKEVAVSAGDLVSWVWRTVSGQDLSFEVKFQPQAGAGSTGVVVKPAAKNPEDGQPVIGCASPRRPAPATPSTQHGSRFASVGAQRAPRPDCLSTG